MKWSTARLADVSELPIQNGLGEAAQEREKGWPRYIRTTDIAGPDILDAESEKGLPPEVAQAAMIQQGDVLLSAAGTVGISHLYESAEPACFAGYLVRVRPNRLVDRRFLLLWTQSQHFLDQIEVGKVRSTIDNFSAGKYRSMRVPVPPLEEQRRIAAFLDAETARIDELIAKKSEMIGLLRERQVARSDALLWEAGVGVPLRRVSELLAGYTFSSDEFGPDEDGPRLLRGVNVGVGAIQWGDAVALNAFGVAPCRYVLYEGDVVIGMDRPFIRGGTRVAVVDKESAGSYLVQRVCRVRCADSAASLIVRHALASPPFRAQVEPDLTGVSVPHLSESQIGAAMVPTAVAEVGAENLAAALTRVETEATELCVILHRQIELLGERRRSLITAAVTGEIEVA